MALTGRFSFKIFASLFVLTTLALVTSAGAAEEEISISGPQGLLKAAYLRSADNLASTLIIPGSGPIDRDGNGGFGIKTNTYKLLAQGLDQHGISSTRIDKRGMFSSRAAIADGNKVTIEDYAEDVLGWATELADRNGHQCVWLLGHSEGGLVALKAVEKDETHVCGLLLVASPGRPLDMLLKEQLKSNPANESLLPAAMKIIDALDDGQTVPESDVPPLLKPLFTSGLQAYMINLFSHDPAELIRAYTGPSLIVQGTKDLQVKLIDAEILHGAAQNADTLTVEGMSHMLKQVEGKGAPAVMATYTNPDLPLSKELVPALAKTILTPDPAMQ